MCATPAAGHNSRFTLRSCSHQACASARERAAHDRATGHFSWSSSRRNRSADTTMGSFTPFAIR